MIKMQQYAKVSPPLPSPGMKMAVLMEMNVPWKWKEEKKEERKGERLEGGREGNRDGAREGHYEKKKKGQANL